MEKQWYNQTIQEVEDAQKTSLEKGLTTEEVKQRCEKYGANELQAQKKKSTFKKILEQFKDFSIIILIIAAIVSGVVGVAQGEGITDTIVILIVVVVNAIIGVAQENKAEKSLEALQKLSSHATKVIRDGKVDVIPSSNLVPGDIVLIEAGDFISADLRIVESVNLKSQEASLTGESLPVEKMSGVIDKKEVGIGDRTNMLFSSSLITYGRGKAIVVETGMNTELGKNARNTTTTKVKQIRKNIGNSCISNMCINIFSRIITKERTN